MLCNTIQEKHFKKKREKKKERKKKRVIKNNTALGTLHSICRKFQGELTIFPKAKLNHRKEVSGIIHTPSHQTCTFNSCKTFSSRAVNASDDATCMSANSCNCCCVSTDRWCVKNSSTASQSGTSDFFGNRACTIFRILESSQNSAIATER